MENIDKKNDSSFLINTQRLSEIVHHITKGQVFVKDMDEEISVDSIQFVKIIIEIEDEYKIEMPNEYLLQQKLNTMRKMVSVIEELIHEQINTVTEKGE